METIVDLGEVIEGDAFTVLRGLRDRAFLELLYATGLRVSELVGIRMNQVNLRQGVVRVVGKGSKDRLVPLGECAEEWIERYSRTSRAGLLGIRQSEIGRAHV